VRPGRRRGGARAAGDDLGVADLALVRQLFLGRVGADECRGRVRLLGGVSHHAGEYQNYIEYFARCLESGATPKPDAVEGIVTVALMQAMDEAAQSGAPVRIKDVLARYNLAGHVDHVAAI